MASGKPFDLDRLFEGSLSRLRAEAEYFSQLSGHNPELGRLNETHLVQMLRAYLPPKIGLSSGFVACGGPNSRQSPQCDIIMFDALNNAPLYKSDAWSIFPIEMVYGIIEVKTRLNKGTLSDAFNKCATIRKMSVRSSGDGNKSYVIGLPPEVKALATFRERFDKLPPRFYVFAYDGWSSERSLESNFRELTESNEDAHIHGVCSLCHNGSYYIQHLAYMPVDQRYSRATTNGFRQFLMNLPAALNSMLPIHRNGLGFDQVNLTHYNLALS